MPFPLFCTVLPNDGLDYTLHWFTVEVRRLGGGSA